MLCFDSFFILNDSKKLTTDNEEFEFEVKDRTRLTLEACQPVHQNEQGQRGKSYSGNKIC